MASLYADENFNYAVVQCLRVLGHDAVTVQEASQQGTDDSQVLAYATASKRAELTFNRRHFIRLHAITAKHAGIIVCTHDDAVALADRIHQSLLANPILDNVLIRIRRSP